MFAFLNEVDLAVVVVLFCYNVNKFGKNEIETLFGTKYSAF